MCTFVSPLQNNEYKIKHTCIDIFLELFEWEEVSIEKHTLVLTKIMYEALSMLFNDIVTTAENMTAVHGHVQHTTGVEGVGWGKKGGFPARP